MSQLPPQSLTNMQLELLKMFAYQLPDEELVELKSVLVRFFAQRVRNRKGYTNETMQTWLNEQKKRELLPTLYS